MSYYDNIPADEMRTHIDMVNRWLWFLIYEAKYEEAKNDTSIY